MLHYVHQLVTNFGHLQFGAGQRVFQSFFLLVRVNHNSKVALPFEFVQVEKVEANRLIGHNQVGVLYIRQSVKVGY